MHHGNSVGHRPAFAAAHCASDAVDSLVASPPRDSICAVPYAPHVSFVSLNQQLLVVPMAEHMIGTRDLFVDNTVVSYFCHL